MIVTMADVLSVFAAIAIGVVAARSYTSWPIKALAFILLLGVPVRYLAHRLYSDGAAFFVLRRYHISPDEFVLALTLSVAGALLFLAGLFSTRGWASGRLNLPRFSVGGDRLTLGAALCLTGGLCGVQLSLVLASYGNPESAFIFFLQRRIPGGYLGFVVPLITFLVLMTSLVGIAAAVKRYKAPGRAVTLILAMLLASYGSLLIGRGYAFVYLIAALFVAVRIPRLGVREIVVAAVFLLAIVVVGQAARLSAQLNTAFESELGRAASDAFGLVSDNVAIVDGLALSIEYVSKEGVRWGGALYSSIVTFIPRAFWSEKPLTTPLVMQEFMSGSVNSGLPVGVMGELYMDFGVIGVLLGAPLLGALFGRGTRLVALGARERHYLGSGVLAFVWMCAFVALIRSGLQSAITIVALYVVFRVLLGVLGLVVASFGSQRERPAVT